MPMLDSLAENDELVQHLVSNDCMENGLSLYSPLHIERRGFNVLLLFNTGRRDLYRLKRRRNTLDQSAPCMLLRET